MRRLIPFIVLFIALPTQAQTTHLNQGWTKEQREEFYFTAQGSQLIPYEWFLAVEQQGSTNLFRDDQNLKRYGMLPTEKSPRNPDALPVGFVRDGVDPTNSEINGLESIQVGIIEESTRFEIKKAFLGNKSARELYPEEQKAWFGLTCAACHTHEIDFQGQTIRIAGGSTQADMESFLRDLGKALEATVSDKQKLKRFADRIGRDSSDQAKLQQEVKQMSEAVNQLVLRNKAQHPYGFGRLDAFGAILNAVCDTALNDPRNRRESNAPVSYPTLWNTPQMGYVQWGATADFAEARNVGEVLGVFGCFSLDPGPKQFDSTVRMKNQIHLEHELLSNLKAPKWPEAILGKLDQNKVELGRKLFEQNCVSCHSVRGSNGEFALNSAGKIPIQSTVPGEIKTDPQFLINLSPQHLAFTGSLKPMFGNMETVPRVKLLSDVVDAIMQHKAAAEGVDLKDFEPKPQAPPNPNGAGFISRPLEGIWASAPYFHNGSVPNLYETLLPAAKRSKSFWVGSRKFDPVNVGFEVGKAELGSEFRVVDANGDPITGNSNAGHEGHGDSQDEGFTQTFENGTWRDFTDEERFALIEYMKWLPGDAGKSDKQAEYELIPDGEADRIANIVDLTAQQMMKRYMTGTPMLRGVHPKDHGCVTAKFQVLPDLPQELSVGVFRPGASYDAFIRFSNAAVLVGPDSTRSSDGKPSHGSRGMAIKLLGVKGDSLLPLNGALTQDFLMVNQPAFAFSNVEDYQVLSQVLLDNNDSPLNFFKIQFTTGSAEAKKRALRTKEIAERISANEVNGDKGAFSRPPASPVDTPYFSASPFRFGNGRVMKFQVVPVNPSNDEPAVDDPNYLRTALIKRLKSESVVFEFRVQVRSVDSLNLAVDIEDASHEWPEDTVTVARLEIPAQDFDSPERKQKCEKLFFTPWHGIEEHQPLGGINRLRKAVYIASSNIRKTLPEPASIDE